MSFPSSRGLHGSRSPLAEELDALRQPPCKGGLKKWVKIKIFILGFWPIYGRTWPRDPPRSTGPAPHINLHKKSAPETNSKAISRFLANSRPNLAPGPL